LNSCDNFVISRTLNGAHMLDSDSSAAQTPYRVYASASAAIGQEALAPNAERLLSLLHWHNYSRTFRKDDVVARELLRVAVNGDMIGAQSLLKDSLLRHKFPAITAANILDTATSLLAKDWQDDVVLDIDVSIALSALQAALRSVLGAVNPPPANGCGTILAAPAPGEPHMLGAAIMSEILFEAGVDVCTENFKTAGALEAWVAGAWVDVVTLHLSPIYLRENFACTLGKLIEGIRARSANPGVRIAVQDPYAFSVLRATPVLGADTISRTATALAPRLLRWVTGRKHARRLDLTNASC
jgi:hypothetical protein